MYRGWAGTGNDLHHFPGLSALAGGLPPTLEDLELHFAGCPLISVAGAASLRDQLPDGLQSFSATFKGTGINRNFASLEDFLAFT